MQLLAVGRHLRLPSERKVVIGRHERENDYIKTCGVEGALLTTLDHPGPTTLVVGNPTRDEVELAARITAGYSDGQDKPTVRVEVRRGSELVEVLTVEPIPRAEAQALMV